MVRSLHLPLLSNHPSPPAFHALACIRHSLSARPQRCCVPALWLATCTQRCRRFTHPGLDPYRPRHPVRQPPREQAAVAVARVVVLVPALVLAKPW